MNILLPFLIPFLVTICYASDSPRELFVYRAHQIDVLGELQGCRSPLMNLEGIRYHQGTLNTIYSRKCVVVRLDEIDSNFESLHGIAGGILIVIPPSLVLTPDKSQILGDWEQSLLSEQIKIPMYFVEESVDVARMIEELDSDALRSMKSTIDFSSTVQQLSVTTTPIALKDPEVVVIESKFQVSDELPTVIISAYYDSYGIAPGLAFGADSNASGVIALMQLMKLMSKLFNDSRRKAKINLISLLSGGGKLNHWGSKKWLEHLDHKVDNNVLSNVAFVISLESLTSSEGPIYVHSSSSIKPDSVGASFISALENRTSVEIITKKINLAEETLAWEHERFATRRLTSFTLSSLSNHRIPSRSSIFDSCDKLNLDILSKRVLDVFNALQIVAFGRIEVKNDIAVSYLQTLLNKLCSVPRSQQKLSSTSSSLVNDLESIVRKFSHSVTVHRFKPNKKQPEFTFYEPSKTKLTIYKSKPIILDLLISGCTILYLGIFYLMIIYVNSLTGFIWKTEKVGKHL